LFDSDAAAHGRTIAPLGAPRRAAPSSSVRVLDKGQRRSCMPKPEPPPPSHPAAQNLTADVEVEDPAILLRLSGPSGGHLKALGAELGVSMGLRGTTLRLQGEQGAVLEAQRILGELTEALAERNLDQSELVRSARTLRAHPDVKLAQLFRDVVLASGGRRIIAPKGVAQQHYVHSIRDHDVVFGIGPAGTGKTYLAMAMAVRALLDKRVKRIVLTRPAV